MPVMKMQYFFVAYFPPAECRFRPKPEVGGVQAKDVDEAFRIAEVRYPLRSGWNIELIPTMDHDEENQVLEYEHEWRCRRDLVNRLIDQNYQCVN